MRTKDLMNLVLSEETRALLSRKLSSGRFSSAEELIQAALENFSENGPGHEDVTSPTDRAKAWLEWVNSHEDGPGLSDGAVRRDAFYD